MPGLPSRTRTNGNPISGATFHFTTDNGLLNQTSGSTAVFQLFLGMVNATVTASVGFVSGSVLVQNFCPTPFPTATGMPSPPGSLVLTASPNTVDRCGGSVFVAATIRDTSGRTVPDGTNVLFLASSGTLNPATGTIKDGTETVVYTASAPTTAGRAAPRSS